MSFAKNCQNTVLQAFGMRQQPRDFGIEIEMEGTGPLGGIPVTGWQVHEEGSLRAPGGEGRGGAEYVTHGTIDFDNIEMLVNRLDKKLVEEGCKVDLKAHRTSTHIHLNVQQLKLIELLGYLTVFTAIEPLFLNLCGDSRDGNAFCIASQDTGDLPDYFLNFCQLIEKMEQRRIELYQRGKYASLSTYRLMDLGTVECRCFPVCLDGKQIKEWAQWLLNIRNLVQNTEDMSFRQVIKLGIHDPLVLIDRVFGYIPEDKCPRGLQRELVSYGSQEAYELTRLLKRYLTKKPEEKKSKIKPPDIADMEARVPIEAFAQWDQQPPQPIGFEDAQAVLRRFRRNA